MAPPASNDVDRYMAAAHAMQTGVATKMTFAPAETQPKHLRVGVNSAMVETSALVQLLISKGIISEDQWAAVLADAMEAEAAKYQAEIQNHFGADGPRVTLR